MVSQGTASRIIVMGPTGSGKSTFINLVSGSTLSVSGGLKSCTSVVVDSRPFVLEDQNVILVDTPGFDDTTRSDTDIISIISTYLANIHRQGVKLSGVIYMHRISDVRMGGTSLLNFRIFQKLCGNESLDNAVIVTTMWSDVDPKQGESREQELATAEDLFKPVLDNGAQLVRHDGTLESAEAILGLFVTNKDTTLRIQRELVDEKKELINTAAGAELARFLSEQASRLDERSRKLQKRMQEASLAFDDEGWTVLQSELDETQKQQRHVEDENERLRRMVSSVMTPPVNDTDIVRMVSAELVERLGGIQANLQAALPTGDQTKTVPQERLNEWQMPKKHTKNGNERLQKDAHAVLEVIQGLKSRTIELGDNLRAALRDGQDRTRTEPPAKRVDQTQEEMHVIQRGLDVAIEGQNKLIAELGKYPEGSGRTICERMVGWLSNIL